MLGLGGALGAFEDAIADYDQLFELIVTSVPPPAMISRGSGVVFRYAEKSAEQAIVQKLARYVSGLRAGLLLIQNGYTQESAVLHRTLDEFAEDIMFLGLAIAVGEQTDVHRVYLEAFYFEDIVLSEGKVCVAENRPHRVSRKQIRKAIDDSNVRLTQQTGNPVPSATSIVRIIGDLFSGFVHAGSQQIMEMYGGRPSRFHLAGMADTPLIPAYVASFWNQFYRGGQSFEMAAIAMKRPDVQRRARARMALLEQAAGKNYGDRRDIAS